ncbi:MAG: hypothetical protein ACI80N_003432, partial [Gammaproteobacteria bacterium]
MPRPVTRTDLSRIPVTKASCDRSRHCKAPNVIITLSQAIELHLRA